jgi:hypothetical protein
MHVGHRQTSGDGPLHQDVCQGLSLFNNTEATWGVVQVEKQARPLALHLRHLPPVELDVSEEALS